jgi:predicted nucleotidyltransferase
MVSEHLDVIRELCARHHAKRLFLFGSAATGGFDPGSSDLDFLVVFETGQERGWDGPFFGLHADLEALFGRSVDLVEAHTLKNPYLIASVNRTKQLLHAA